MYKQIIASSKWSESHGAVNNFAGMGSIYYALTYTYKAKKCVCLGSGGGFVPKLMHLAQQTLWEYLTTKEFSVLFIVTDYTFT
jgi:hypothetical protein